MESDYNVVKALLIHKDFPLSYLYGFCNTSTDEIPEVLTILLIDTPYVSVS